MGFKKKKKAAAFVGISGSIMLCLISNLWLQMEQNSSSHVFTAVGSGTCCPWPPAPHPLLTCLAPSAPAAHGHLVCSNSQNCYPTPAKAARGRVFGNEDALSNTLGKDKNVSLLKMESRDGVGETH